MLRLVTLAVCFSLAQAQEPAVGLPPAPLFRKLQAKMSIEFCSKNTASELEPCKAEVFQERLKGLTNDEKKAKIESAIAEVEAKRKKKLALIMHEDTKTMYDQFCAPNGPKAKSEICGSAELKAFLEAPLIMPPKNGPHRY